MGAFDDLILIPASPKDTNAAKESSTPTREQIVNNETPSKPKPVGGVVPPGQKLVPGIQNGLDELPTFSLGAPLVRSTSPVVTMPTGYSNPAKMEPVAESMELNVCTYAMYSTRARQ